MSRSDSASLTSHNRALRRATHTRRLAMLTIAARGTRDGRTIDSVARVLVPRCARTRHAQAHHIVRIERERGCFAQPMNALRGAARSGRRALARVLASERATPRMIDHGLASAHACGARHKQSLPRQHEGRMPPRSTCFVRLRRRRALEFARARHPTTRDAVLASLCVVHGVVGAHPAGRARGGEQRDQCETRTKHHGIHFGARRRRRPSLERTTVVASGSVARILSQS